MPLPLDVNSTDYQFYKTLHEDVKLVSNEYGEWDLDFENDDWVNVTGVHSLANACIIAIMTRLNELNYVELYEDFGCRAHELIKKNKSRNIIYQMEIFITEVLENMRRVQRVNYVKITDSPDNQDYTYRINFSITSIMDDEEDGEIIEESFNI
ncbi:MAG: hypothetical protein IJF83_05995 [Methanobrevibacter sp.]|nr:hypothetical protein [Methanobrevibacter sp.]